MSNDPLNGTVVAGCACGFDSKSGYRTDVVCPIHDFSSHANASPVVNKHVSPTPTIEEILEEYAYSIASAESGEFVGDIGDLMTTQEAVAALTLLITKARIDENDIWLAHSTSRRLVDTEPAIRTVDFQERVAELKAAKQDSSHADPS
jgi:hypothetical protein